MQHEKINYVELPAANLEATKQFFQTVFGWEFEDFGTDYSAFTNQGLDGGFYRADLAAETKNGSALVIFYSNALQTTQDKIKVAGGIITQEIFTFPGGCRFHFKEPSGNEFAVWSDKCE